jgi:hypothetical protein
MIATILSFVCIVFSYDASLEDLLSPPQGDYRVITGGGSTKIYPLGSDVPVLEYPWMTHRVFVEKTDVFFVAGLNQFILREGEQALFFFVGTNLVKTWHEGEIKINRLKATNRMDVRLEGVPENPIRDASGFWLVEGVPYFFCETMDGYNLRFRAQDGALVSKDLKFEFLRSSPDIQRSIKYAESNGISFVVGTLRFVDEKERELTLMYCNDLAKGVGIREAEIVFPGPLPENITNGIGKTWWFHCEDMGNSKLRGFRGRQIGDLFFEDHTLRDRDQARAMEKKRAEGRQNRERDETSKPGVLKAPILIK